MCVYVCVGGASILLVQTGTRDQYIGLTIKLAHLWHPLVEYNTWLTKHVIKNGKNFTSNFGIFLLVPPSNASTGRYARFGALISTKKF